jgi:methylase of polypeptide subunit release factors
MRRALLSLRRQWSGSSIGSESTLHQLAPYIGKLKTSIAGALVSAYSRPGDTVLEPFSGSGAVALEALSQGRHVIANDLSPYAAVLTRAKLFPPASEAAATHTALRYLRAAKRSAKARRYRVRAPKWVRQFFHPKTLAETHALTQLLLRDQQWFLLACVLGILHHQRPGFLSYPSSHLVPYLRLKKFPRRHFLALYRYRDPEPRLLAKIKRAYRRAAPIPAEIKRTFTASDIRELKVQERVDLLLTSPPYMNALDYGRDNRLRLWFLGVENYREVDRRNCRTPEEFAELIGHLAELADQCLSPSGTIVLVIGEVRRKKQNINTAEIVKRVLIDGGRFRLVDAVQDLVPDLRRCRRYYCATKREWVLVFARNIENTNG